MKINKNIFIILFFIITLNIFLAILLTPNIEIHSIEKKQDTSFQEVYNIDNLKKEYNIEGENVRILKKEEIKNEEKEVVTIKEYRDSGEVVRKTFLKNKLISSEIFSEIAGIPHGEAVLIYEKGAVQKYNYLNGKKEGISEIKYFNGEREVLSFEEDKPHGKAIYYFPNGDKDIYYYKNGVKDGEAMYIHSNGRTIYYHYENGDKKI